MLAKKIKVALGILARRPLTGPVTVSVDLTRKCTMGCVMCWYWSPLIKEKPSCAWSEEHLEYPLFLRLLEDLRKLQVKNIIFGGQGDPFLHPDIMRIIAATKKAGIGVSLITSGNYFSAESLKGLVELGVDELDVSLHAATPEVYGRMHPSLKPGVFGKIKADLIRLKELKAAGSCRPYLRLIDAVCGLNYKDAALMPELAAEVGASHIGYKRMDVIPETRSLLMTPEQVRELDGLLAAAESRAAALGVTTSLGFFRRYIVPGLTTGEYTTGYYSEVPCYVGWLSSRVLSDGSVVPCCGCYNPPLGNIRRSSFAEIWKWGAHM